jgi:hypothetical protein
MKSQFFKKKSKTLVFTGLLFISQSINAQVTINNGDFPNGGDTCLVSISNQTTIVDYTTTGASQTWDFSYLEATSQRIDTFFNINSSSALYQLSFNNWLTAADYNSDYYNKLINNNLPAIPGGTVTLENPVFFSKNSSSKLEIVGIGVEVNGIEVPVQSDTIDVVYEFPLTFNDAWYSRSYFNMDMNPIYDAQFKRQQQRDAVVDGWGQITTPFGTFDAIRVKTTLTYQDSIYLDLPVIGGSWLAIPTPETVEYHWLTNANKIPVLKIITQAGIATSIEYRDHAVTSFASANTREENIFKLFPNPVSNDLTIQTNNSSNLVEIIDVNGKLILSKTISNAYKLNVSNWSKGMYFIKVTNDHAVTTQTFIVE